jgi:hypothetical protein
MEDIFGANSNVVTVSLIVCAVLAAVGTAFLSKSIATSIGIFLRRAYELRYRAAALRAARQFELGLEQCQERAAMVSNFSADYASVFNDANWSKSVMYLDDLRSAYDEVGALIESGDYKEAMCLAEFFCSDGVAMDDWKYAYFDEAWDHLYNWRAEQDQIMREIAVQISKVALDERKLGVVKSAVRRPSGVALEKLRKELCID